MIHSKAAFQAAPAFSLSKWAEHSQSSRVTADYLYFGQKPYFNDTEPLGYVQLSSKIINLPVRNLHNELLGTVTDFFYDLPADSIEHVILTMPGVRQTKSAIPASALQFNAAHDALLLDVSAKEFKNEPRFRWTYGNLGDFQQETYANTKVAANDGVNTKQNVKEGTAASYTPLVQGTSYADVDITHQIYSLMRADTNLSQNAQNVEVGTLDGRVTLRGHVNTPNGKREIGSAAATVAHPENVSNLLEVRPIAVKQ